MFTTFKIIRDEVFNLTHLSHVLAVLDTSPTSLGWQDPHGGTFTDEEKSAFYEVAAGRQTFVRLVDRGPISCRLVAGF